MTLKEYFCAKLLLSMVSVAQLVGVQGIPLKVVQVPNSQARVVIPGLREGGLRLTENN
jgi:hypothetical protein